MILRSLVFFILIILVPDIYIWLHYYRTRYLHNRMVRVLWWLPCLCMIAYTVALSTIRNFVPTDITWINTYLCLFGLFIVPKALFAVCSWLGSALRAVCHTRYNYGHRIGLAAGVVGALAYIYGMAIGVGSIVVRHVDLNFKDLPAEFDGYRVLQISDIHSGTFNGWRRRILKAEIDSVLAQKNIDLVCFTGDMENMSPSEAEAMMPELRRLPYMYSVLGNHDYGQYVKASKEERVKMTNQLIGIENKLGRVLLNGNVPIRRKLGSGRLSTDSIWLAGSEDYSRVPEHDHSDLKKTLKGIPPKAFVILLQHDPTAWEKDILPHSNAQLTLSGHTHGGQMQLFGLRPTMLTIKEDFGLYQKDGRYIYVNAGLGGVVPFRFNMPCEITVITLHKA